MSVNALLYLTFLLDGECIPTWLPIMGEAMKITSSKNPKINPVVTEEIFFFLASWGKKGLSREYATVEIKQYMSCVTNTSHCSLVHFLLFFLSVLFPFVSVSSSSSEEASASDFSRFSRSILPTEEWRGFWCCIDLRLYRLPLNFARSTLPPDSERVRLRIS